MPGRGGGYVPGFVPSGFNPDDPMAMQKMQAQALLQQQPQSPDSGQEDVLMSLLGGAGPTGDVMRGLFPALGFAQQNLPMFSLARGLMGMPGVRDKMSGALGGLFGGGG